VNRLDKIEHEAREVAKYMEMGGGTDGTGVGDTLALVAVARAAADVREMLTECDCIHSDRESPLCPCRALRAALAPLLEQVKP